MNPLAHRVSSGVAGLDEVLNGGFVPGRSYLIRGGPGAGKTTLGLHFLSAGLGRGEKALLITLGEPANRIQDNARALGFQLADLAFLDLSPSPDFFTQAHTYDIFSPAEVERDPTTRRIIEQVESLRPQRVFLDAMTQFRYLATDPHQFRRQVLSFLQYLLEQGITVLLTSEVTKDVPDDDLCFLSDGVITLEQDAQGRTVTVSKFRGSGFRSGRHSVSLTGSGMVVAPCLVPAGHVREYVACTLSSGNAELDALLGGGLERGTVTVLRGPSGTGKTTVGMQFLKAAAERGEHAVAYVFEEPADNLLSRCEAIHLPMRPLVTSGLLQVVPIEALRYSANDFACLVRRQVEERQASMILFDSISGYRLALRGEDLNNHLYALSRYLTYMGITTLIVSEAHLPAEGSHGDDIAISYLADNLLVLRYLEAEGELRKTIGVMKKRRSDFEKGLRELRVSASGLQIGPPLAHVHGLLTNCPELIASIPEKKEPGHGSTAAGETPGRR